MTIESNPYAAQVTSGYMAPELGSGLLADRSTRFVAALVDGILLSIIAIPIVLIIMLGIGPLIESDTTRGIIAVLGSIIATIGAFLLVNGYLLSKSGQTVGKKIFNIKIVKDDGSLMPFAPLFFKRYVVMGVLNNIPYIGGLIGLANALCIFRESRKRIHDEIAGTKVVKI